MVTSGNRPVAPLDSYDRPVMPMWWDTSYLGDNGGGATLIYIGKARPGSAQTASVWQIRKLTYDANGNIIQIAWPKNAQGNPSNDFEFQWSARAGYTYST
jgi:YD repeat-containing protein